MFWRRKRRERELRSDLQLELFGQGWRGRQLQARGPAPPLATELLFEACRKLGTTHRPSGEGSAPNGARMAASSSASLLCSL
jgi:hypothetical protein